MNNVPPADKVNLFMGTAGDHGQLYPGAEMPFGFVKLAPDTYPGAVTGNAHAGDDYDDARLLGFSHLRWSGVGNVGVDGLPGRRHGRVGLLHDRVFHVAFGHSGACPSRPSAQ